MLLYYFMQLKLIYTDITAMRHTHDSGLKIRKIAIFYPGNIVLCSRLSERIISVFAFTYKYKHITTMETENENTVSTLNVWKFEFVSLTFTFANHPHHANKQTCFGFHDSKLFVYSPAGARFRICNTDEVTKPTRAWFIGHCWLSSVLRLSLMITAANCA